LIVADANVLIAHFDAADAHHERAVADLLAAGEQPLGASPITLAEVLAAPAREGRLQAARAALAQLDVREVELGSDSPARLATLRAETSLKLPDCCVLLAAQNAPASELLTFDDRLAEQARRIGLRVR